ncbi:putative disease resistance protein [Cinnamomum micranthum f. kanehirae]|uniref:Putative disease resistance protein n=1 Tax=Cinnamomum micranthum f. kanehirae TaxID=337451 RepID=A0A443N0E0_9MAGN|nr:putative disease resistance protein [Cinnamomum micranthum f. kanehirae]
MMDTTKSVLETGKSVFETGKSVLQTGKLLYDIFGKQIGHITNPEKNMEELDKNARYLFARRDDVEEITRESPNVATRESRLWLEDVKKLEVEVQSIKDEHMRCSNVFKRSELGKRVGDVIEEITDLNNKRPKLKGKEFSNAPLERVEPQIVEINSSTDSKTRLHGIMGYIEDARIRKIGIWGMGGIGKTRSLKLLNNRLEESHMFDIVIWVTVSGEGSRRKVQNDIAERLKCTALDMSDDRLKVNIYHHLRGKKFLLILDDIWEKIDLVDVGIPILNQDNGCKVLLTTRDLDVCRQMQTDLEIQMEKLSEEEAWSLFNEKVGDVAMSPRIEPIARDIVKKCGGLPLAIIVIGSSLRKISYVGVWRNTLRKLQLPSKSQIKGMEKEVFSCLRISYDRLPNDCERNLFLYCSLFPEDCEIRITELVEYCWLEGYIQRVDSIEEARDDGRHMVMNLVDASLLERGYYEERVKMHDIIRDFALKEASGFLVKTGRHVKQPPEEKEWLQSQKISLMQCSLGCLSERPNSSTLSTLLLQDNDQLTMIPGPFFECMHSLCILDLSRTEIKSLPSSLWNLVKLRGLYLKDCCNLEELPSQVGALRQLEVLHLGGCTAIKYLPIEVGELTRLRRLIVGFQYRNCSQNYGEDTKEWNMKLRVPTGIIPNLLLLEELGLYVYVFDKHPQRPLYLERDYVEKEQWDDESMEVVVKEFCRLEHLTYLDAYFPRVGCLERFLRHRKSMKESWFRRFRFRVGTEIREIMGAWYVPGQEWERCLVYKGGLGMSHATIYETLAHCSYFQLHDHRTVRKLSELCLANMNELKECRAIDCEKMETLFDGDEQRETCALLPNLETLFIKNLPEFRSLCDGPLLPGSLSKLRELHFHSCKNLKKVFQLSIIRQLCSLETLYVTNCLTVEELIEIEEEEEISMSVASHTHNVISNNNDRLILHNTKKIYLSSLPELVSICRGFSNFEWPSLETIEIYGCPKLKSLSFLSNGTNIVAPALREIEGSSSWWEALEWEDNDIKQRLQPFLKSW